MARWKPISAVLVLVVLAASVYFFPRAMLSPGGVEPGHLGLAGDCFACHVPFRGAAAEKCIGCHAVADIGARTTKGVPLSPPHAKAGFHRGLLATDCVACHAGHRGPLLARDANQSFSHELLPAAARGQCATCHTAPASLVHRDAGSNCLSCHTETAWRPATFDHSRFFRLGGEHDAPCATCHIGADPKRYTCLGCHEHQSVKLQQKHARHGISDMEDCARCHRDTRHRDREKRRDRD